VYFINSIKYSVVSVALLATTCADAYEPNGMYNEPCIASIHMHEGVIVRPPRGYVTMCDSGLFPCSSMMDPFQYENDLDNSTLTGEIRLNYDNEVIMVEGMWDLLSYANRKVNDMIEHVSDYQNYGVVDHWIPSIDKGDCEDYVLTKKLLLMKMGWPESSLMIAIARTQISAYDYHAVLVVKTDQGDFVLDSANDVVSPWCEVGYNWVMRQSERGTNNWVRIVNSVQ